MSQTGMVEEDACRHHQVMLVVRHRPTLKQCFRSTIDIAGKSTLGLRTEGEEAGESGTLRGGFGLTRQPRTYA